MKGKVFTAQEVQAIIVGNKTQFREVIKPQPIQPEGFPDAYFDCYNKSNQWNWWTKDNKQLLGQVVKCPYKVGQKIFCKESFAEILYASDSEYRFGKKIIYRAEDDSHIIWKPAQHMKQKHSRLTLLIKEIRVERLVEISEEDCIKEGMEKTGCYYLESDAFGKLQFVKTEISNFKSLWNATHKKPEEKFETNPFVWIISFEVVND